VDPYGNFNNIAFGKDSEKPRLRLPGTGGIPDVTTYMPETYLYVPRHSRVTFVKELDHLSGLGHHQNRVRGGGPVYLISDLGQFDFPSGRMRLKSLHPGVSVDRVIAKTGFDIDIPDRVQTSTPPTAHEIELLRKEIDPLGVRKLELLSGPRRRDALREALKLEGHSQN
jgi:acyl CoA:acetate/3-ketoacid CoA transferase beta subunit